MSLQRVEVKYILLKGIKKFKLIDESYNANPLSVKSAIQNFDSIKKQNFKKYLLLGDMLELGKKLKSSIKIYQKLLTIQILTKCLLKEKSSINL